MTLQVGVLLLADRLDHNQPTLGPDEVHVRRVNYHTVFALMVEADA